VLKFLPTPIGNLQDITIRTIEELKNAEIIFCEDTRVSKRLLFLLNEKLNISFGQKEFIPLHSHNEKKQIEKYSETLRNKNCVYVSDAGMPCISDPGSELVKFCQLNSIKYEVLPGANALLPAFCASGFSDGQFLFYGFLPHKKNDRRTKLKELLAENIFPIIFYESPHRLLDFLVDISELFPDRRLFLAKELTKLHEKFFSGTTIELLNTIQKEKILGEWVVIADKNSLKATSITLNIEDLLALSLPKKELAKLISKISGENPKTVYEKLLQ